MAAITWFGSRVRGEGVRETGYAFLLETSRSVAEAERDRFADIAVDLRAEYGVLADVHRRISERMRGVPDRYAPFLQIVRDEGVPN